MYNGFSTSPSDLFPVSIPVLSGIPGQNIPLSTQHRPFRSDRIESIIASHTTTLYLKTINWENIVMTRFPSSISMVPAVIYYKDPTHNGVCINMDVATASLDLNANTINISDFTAMATCVLFGINKLLLYTLEDEQILSDFYNAMCGFIYVLIMRMYSKEFDLTGFTDQTIANVYYLIAKMVGTSFMRISGNLNALATVSAQRFFVKPDKNNKLKPTLRFSVDRLPRDVDVASFGHLFSYMDRNNIMPSVDIENFRSKIANFFSLSLLAGLGTGLDFASMLCTLRLPSGIFNQRVASIRPASVGMVGRSMNDYLVQVSNENQEIKERNTLPSWE